jgi:hypothetical protein
MDDSKGTLANLLKTLREQNASKAGTAPSEEKEELKTQIEETKKQNEVLKKSEETLKRIEESIKGNSEQLKVLPKNLADKLNVKLSDIKVPEEDKTTLESIKELVGDTKSFFGKLGGGFGKGFDFVKNPMGAVRGGIEKVKELGTKAQDTFYDIAETKAGYTAEEGRFVEEYKKQNRQFASGMTREEVVSGKLQDQGTDAFRQTKDLEEKIKAAEADIAKSNKFGFQATPEDQQKLDELKKLKDEVDVRQKPEEKLKEVEGKQTKNEEADNVVSAQEAMADSFKENTELLKDLLTTTKDQLDSVKAIKDSLAPKGETDEQNNVQQKKEKFYGDVATKLDEISGKLDNVGSGSLLGSAVEAAGDFLGKGKQGGKPAGKPAGGAAGKLGKIGTIGKIGGAALAVAGGAYTAYSGFSEASDEQEAQLANIEAKKKSGELTSDQAAAMTKQVNEQATEKKGGAIGKGTGMAAGGLAGMKLGGCRWCCRWSTRCFRR